MPKQRAHLYIPEHVVRSVLLETKVSAACGDERVLTRASVDAAVGMKPCSECIVRVNAKHDSYTVKSARGWVAFLEQFETNRLTSEQLIVSTYIGTYPYSTVWPSDGQ